MEEEEKGGDTSRFLDLVQRVMGIFENLPQAFIGISLLVSLCVGGAGAWGALVSPEQKDINVIEERVLVLEKEVSDLKIWNSALREILAAVLTGSSIKTEKVEFEGFLLDVGTGEVEPLKGKKK